jgi:hypothetical protein
LPQITQLKFLTKKTDRDDQIRFAVVGTGFAGSSMDYLRNIQENFAARNVHDQEADAPLTGAEAFLASR